MPYMHCPSCRLAALTTATHSSREKCSRCGTRVAPGRAAFDPDAGGLCCARCAHPSALALTAGARAALVQLQRRGMAGAQAPLSADGSDRPADPRAFEEAAGEAARALSAFVAHHLGRSPRVPPVTQASYGDMISKITTFGR